MSTYSSSQIIRPLTPKLVDCGHLPAPRHERNHSGGLDYILDIDVAEFDPSEIKVCVCGYTVVVEANTEESCFEGSKVRHDFKREVHLPNNILPEKLTSLYKDNGMLELRAPLRQARIPSVSPIPHHVRFVDKDDGFRYKYGYFRPLSPHWYSNAHSRSRNLSSKSSSTNKHIYTEKYIYPRSRSLLDSPRYTRAPVHIEYDYENSPESSKRYTTNASTAHNPKSMSRGNLNDWNYSYRDNDNGYYTQKVSIDPTFKPEDISVLVENGVVVITAKHRNTDRCVNDKYAWAHREFSCEHTLPNNVDASRVNARILNGIITLEAPYRTYTRCVFSNESVHVPLRSSYTR